MILDEAIKQGLETKIIFYEEAGLEKEKLTDGGKKINIGPEHKIIIRWPWDADNTDIYYGEIVKYLCEKFASNIALDGKCLSRFSPDYEDKYFQAKMFRLLGVSTPMTVLAENGTIKLNLPIVFKKRISSRSKGNFLLEGINDLNNKLRGLEKEKYIIQEKVDAVLDLRILILGGELIGAVSRFMHVREQNRLSVKGMEVYENISDELASDCKKIINYLGADLVGFDVLVDKRGDYFFIEANLSPQFNSFSTATNVNVAKKIVELIKNETQTL